MRYSTRIKPISYLKANAAEVLDDLQQQRQPLITVRRAVLTKNRASLIVCTVRKDSVTVTCDGRPLIEWRGDAKLLGLSEYWSTPHGTALFLGAYDCRYRFHRVWLTPLAGQGRQLR